MIDDLVSSVEQAENVYKVGLNSTRALMALGDVVVGWLLLRQADVALGALAGGTTDRDRLFYEGKVPPPGGSPPTSCPSSAPSEPSPKPST